MQDRAGTISIRIDMGFKKTTFSIVQTKFVEDLLLMIWDKEGKKDTEYALFYAGEPGNRRRPAMWLDRDKQLRFYKIRDDVGCSRLTYIHTFLRTS